MWYYQIVNKYGECIEGGMFHDEKSIRRYCERRMRQLEADNWYAYWEED